MMRVLGIPVKISPLLPVLLLSGMVLGLGAELGIALSSLILHEFSHAMAARALRVRVQEIELMPLGGAARMEDIWGLRPAQVILIALAGPAANAVLILVASSLCWGGVLGPWTAMLWIETNMALMLFNLLPALPLDGGRLMCAALGNWIGPRRALRLFATLGKVVGALLIALAVAMAALHGLINVTLLFAGAFLIASAARELRLSEGAPLLSLLKRREELSDEGALPVRWLAALATESPAQLLSSLQARALHRIAVYTDGLELIGVIEEGELLARADAESLHAILTRGA